MTRDDIPSLPPHDPNDPLWRSLLEARVEDDNLERALSTLPLHLREGYERWSRQREELKMAFQVVCVSDDEREIFAASQMIARSISRWALEGRIWRKTLSELVMRLPPEPIYLRPV